MLFSKTVFRHPKNLFLALFLFCFSAGAQFREEMGTLETMYESRARSVINTVLHPYEYSLVVAVDIDRDETRLAKLQEEFEKDTLPGMGGASTMDNPVIANQLYELKNKIDIHLVLANKITKEKEATITSLLKMKLHLDEKAGDSLTIARSDLPTAVEDGSVSKLPELSWKMWGMVTVLLLLTLSGIFYFFDRRAKAAKEAAEALAKKDDKKEDEKPLDKAAAQDAAGEKAAEALPTIDPSELMYEQKQQILSLTSQYPEAAADALSEHFQKGNEHDVLLMCESFGWEVSKKIFAGFSPRMWGRLGFLVVEEKNHATLLQTSEALENCGKIILKKFLEIGAEDSKNPFGFLWNVSKDERERLLSGESAINMALICAHGKPDQVSELMAALGQDMQEAVTIAVSRMSQFSDQQAKAISESLLKKFKTIKENPETKMNGIEIAAGLIRSLPAEKEYSFFEKLQSQNPSDAEKIRRTILLFPDVVYVPGDVISDMAALLDMSVIVTALRGSFPEVREFILKSMPPKKSYMIQRDLELDSLESEKQIAMSQREIVLTVTSLLKAKNIELDNLFEKLDVRADNRENNLNKVS
jgi:flagellar motor switch protein FliG